MKLVNQTQNNCKYYLYQYVRLDKNEVFYVGIGTRYKSKTDFTRATMSHRHNSICVAIINKTDYRIEIIAESDNNAEIRQQEMDLVTKYGRIDLKTGSLANMTNGGEIAPTYADFSPERREQLSADRKFRFTNNNPMKCKDTAQKSATSRIGQPYSDEARQKVSEGLRKSKQFQSAVRSTAKRQKCRNAKRQSMVPVEQYDKDMSYINSFESIKAAARSLGINPQDIQAVLSERQKSTHGWIFKKISSLPMPD